MIQKIFEDLRENGHVVVSELHTQYGEKYHGEINHITVISKESSIMEWTEDDIGKYWSVHQVSGGEHECAWNYYAEKFDNFIDALTYLMPIEDVVGAKDYEQLDARLDKSWKV